MTELEEINKHIDVLEKAIARKDEKWFGDKANDNKSFKDYWEYVYNEKIEIYKLKREIYRLKRRNEIK
jgi:hypothetical protein